MTKYINQFPQHFDLNGAPLAGYTVFFGVENEDTILNPKAVYTDADFLNVGATSYTLDSTGSIGLDIFLDGPYSVRIEDTFGGLWRETPSTTGLGQIGMLQSYQDLLDIDPNTVSAGRTVYMSGVGIAGHFRVTTGVISDSSAGVLLSDATWYAAGKHLVRVWEGPVLAPWFDIAADWNGASGTNNTPAFQSIIDLMDAGHFDRVDFPESELPYYFAPLATKSTCIFLPENSAGWPDTARSLFIGGGGTIAIDNNGANNVWISGPEGDGTLNRASDWNIIGKLTITSSDVDTGTYSDPNTTMPNWGIGFNVSRWTHSKFTFRNYFAKGLVQSVAADALYDSTSNITQQIDLINCDSSYHQDSFMDATSLFGCSCRGGTFERGNGAFSLRRSSGQSFYKFTFDNNIIQGNGKNSPFICNFGVGLSITNNYWESNRSASGVAVEHIDMRAQAVLDLNSLTIEGNLFAQSITNLDGYGSAYASVVLDGFNNFFPKSNDFTGGNGYKLTNSTGLVYSEGETYTALGSIYVEGAVTTGGSISGVVVSGYPYIDSDTVPVVKLNKIIVNDLGFKTYEAVTITAGTAYEFRKIGRPHCTLVAAFTTDTIVTFVAADAGAAPEPLTATAATLVDFSATPSVPAAGRIDVSVAAGSDFITVYNNLGSDRKFVLEQLGGSDWM